MADMNTCYSLGFDFGTESVRAVLVNTRTGEEIADNVYSYPHGVIYTELPTGELLPEGEWALQHPSDYLEALRNVVQGVLRSSGVDSRLVVGIGIDFTACTLIPTFADGTPLCLMEDFARRPHAWPKLWKHHGAQKQADRITETAQSCGEPFLKYYSGRVSCEWAYPKMLQVLEEDPEVFQAAEKFVEGGDWIVWMLTGRLSRNTCAAGFKALYTEGQYPSASFLSKLDPMFASATKKIDGQLLAPGVVAGYLTPQMAEMLGLRPGIPVSAAIIDAHAGVLGCGITQPDAMVMILGTSSCQIVMSKKPVFFQGFAGLVKDGVIEGYYAYEYGQPATGDVLAWYVRNFVNAQIEEEAKARRISIHQVLSERAAQTGSGHSGILALDWHNGNRSILMDSRLSGLILGLTLNTRPEEVYRALIESTAFGALRIIETHEAEAGRIEQLYACGGLTHNSFLMQIYADILGKCIRVPMSSQPVALGSAVLGAAAAGSKGGGHDSVIQAVQAMVKPSGIVYRPRPEVHMRYSLLYRLYTELHDYFGLRNPMLMNRLRGFCEGGVGQT